MSSEGENHEAEYSDSSEERRQSLISGRASKMIEDQVPQVDETKIYQQKTHQNYIRQQNQQTNEQSKQGELKDEISQQKVQQGQIRQVEVGGLSNQNINQEKAVEQNHQGILQNNNELYSSQNNEKGMQEENKTNSYPEKLQNYENKLSNYKAGTSELNHEDNQVIDDIQIARTDKATQENQQEIQQIPDRNSQGQIQQNQLLKKQEECQIRSEGAQQHIHHQNNISQQNHQDYKQNHHQESKIEISNNKNIDGEMSDEQLNGLQIRKKTHSEPGQEFKIQKVPEKVHDDIDQAYKLKKLPENQVQDQNLMLPSQQKQNKNQMVEHGQQSNENIIIEEDNKVGAEVLESMSSDNQKRKIEVQKQDMSERKKESVYSNRMMVESIRQKPQAEQPKGATGNTCNCLIM